MYVCIVTVTINTFCIIRIHMIYIYIHTCTSEARGGGGARGSHGPPGFLKFPITLFKKSQIRQKNLSLAPLEK